MASDELYFTLKLRDEFSDTLRDMQSELDQLHAKLRQATDGTSNATANDIDRLNDKIRATENDSQTLSAAIDKLDRNIDELGDEAAQTSGQLDRVSRSSGKTSKGLSGVWAAGKGAALGVTAVAAAAVTGVVAFSKLNTAVGQYQQNINKSKAVFGSQLGSMRKWAKAHRDDFGGSTQDVLSYAASLQDLIVPMGFSRKEATGMTKDLGSLVPVLTEWDRKGRSASEITDILQAALTGERDALKSLGITISEDAVKKQIELMRSHGKLKGATDEQANAQATLALLYKKTGDAQANYKKNSDSVVRRTRDMESQVRQLKDDGLAILLKVWNRTAEAFADSGFGDGLKQLSKWLNQNQDQIVSGLLNIGSTLVRFGGWVLKALSFMQSGWQMIVEVIAGALRFASYLDPRLKGAADKAAEFADATRIMGDKLDEAGEAAFRLSDNLHEQANAAGRAQEKTKQLRDILDTLPKKKEIRVTVKTVVKGFQTLGIGAPVDDTTVGDTRSPWGGPRLGPAGLAAAHSAYSTGRGMRVTSGIRDFGLGSARSDHRFGRAMDVRGPFLGAYARRVRESGGYAAMHGVGPGRHLHVAPRGMPEAGGDVTNVYDIDIHTGGGPVRPFDLRNAVDAGIRQAERRRRERGGA